MKDDRDPSEVPQQDEEESPAIYSVGSSDGQLALSRRSFWEMSAAAAGVVALSNGCATLANRGRTGPILAHKEAVTALAVSATGKLLASGDKEGHIKLWQLPEGVLLQSWAGHESPIANLSFLGKEDTLWSLDSSGALKRWQLPSGKEVSEGESIRGNTRGCGSAFAVPGAADWYFACGSAHVAELRVQTTGQKLRSLVGFDDKINAMAATWDGRFLLIGGEDGKLGLWTEPAGNTVRTIKTGAATVSALTLDPNGTRALSAHANGRLRLWRIPEMSAPKEFKSTLGKPFSVSLRRQLDLFVVGIEKPEIGLWNLAVAAEAPQLLKGHTAAVRATVITPDGLLLISGSEDKTIRLWSLPDGRHLRNLMDLAVNYENVTGAGYKGTDVYGRNVTFTLPCGSPIPPGAVCTCNCVPGSLTIPKNHSQEFGYNGVCTCDLICTCNTVCTCQSVGSGRGYSYYVTYWYPN